MRENNQPYSDPSVLDNYRNLYTRYYPKLYNYGRKFTTDVTLIEDSIQDIFLDYWKRKDIHDQPTAINSYLFSAFRYSLFKKINRERRLIALSGNNDDPDFSADHFISQPNAAPDMERQIQAALRQLTARQREALFLRFYEGLSYEEIAVVMSLSVKASYKLMARALLQLKHTLSLPAWLLVWAALNRT
jgi:RNA polymerase sigma factor (sigma-70 family)